MIVEAIVKGDYRSFVKNSGENAAVKDNKEFELLGPSLPYIFKENEKFRMKILIKSKNRNLIIETLNNVNKEFNKEAKERKCIVQFDIDTYQLL